MKNQNIGITLMAVAACIVTGASAVPSVTIDSVSQRWPWNNKIDITYTISGGTDLVDAARNGGYTRIVFTANIGGTPYTIDGSHDVIAKTCTGTHTVTWTLPSGVKRKDCTISAAIYASDAPSGDDYMVVDLENGGVSFEGLLATQEASNARYNTPEYKTSKLVLRKVPAGGPYPTGDSVHYPSENPSRTWTTERDFWIGVFPVTQAQYAKLCGSNPSYFPKDATGNPAAYRPVENVSWYDIRRPVGETGNFASNADIPAVSAPSGNFLQRLRLLGGNKYPFDLPTEVMAEIAERAGSDAVYYWGGSPNADYVTYSGNAGSPTSTQDVGARLPNAWGLYDTCGNVWEWCLDDGGLGNLAEAPDPFTPRWTPGTYRRRRCGGSVWNPLDSVNHRASMRSNTTEPAGNAGSFIGFRVALVGE